MKIFYFTLLLNCLQADRLDRLWLDLHRSEHGTTTVLLQHPFSAIRAAVAESRSPPP